MDKAKLFGLIRHALTILGGAVVAKGYLEDAMVEEIIGIVISGVGVVWSIIDKNKQE